MYYIYTLNHPDNGIPFYVGMTKRHPEARLESHVLDAKNQALGGLISIMRQFDRYPIIEVIDTTETLRQCLSRERELIREYGKKYVLLNSDHLYTLSGDAKIGCVPGNRCKDRVNCDYCGEYYMNGRIDKLKLALSDGCAVYKIDNERWKTASTSFRRHGVSDYIKLTEIGNGTVYYIAHVEQRHDMDLFDCSDITPESLLKNTCGRGQFKGKYALTSRRSRH